MYGLSAIVQIFNETIYIFFFGSPAGTKAHGAVGLHDSEPNCGVKKAVEDGKISKERYEHYLMNLQDVKKKEERKYG